MNPLTLCLSIVPLGSVSHAPSPVIEIVQNRIIQQIKQENPLLLVNFGSASCPNVIHYEEDLSSLKLLGSAGLWSGEKSISYTDALSDRPLNFDENLKTPQPPYENVSAVPSSIWKSWILWGGIAAVAGSVIYLKTHNSNSSKPSQNKPGTVNLRRGITF